MNLAIAQAALDGGGHSQSLTRMLSAIEAAAKISPAPDLIVVPNFADEIAGVDAQAAVTPAMCRGMTEAFSLQAREWGVWLAVGHALVQAGAVVRGATFFDPDGDPVMRLSAPHASEPCAQARYGIFVDRPIPMAHVVMGLLDGETIGSLEEPACDAEWDLLVLFRLRGEANDHSFNPSFNAVEDFARRHECVVVVNDKESAMVVGSSGETLVETRPGTATTEAVHLPIAPLATSTLDQWANRQRDKLEHDE